jgi:tRNA(Ile)-lysidine synthase
LNIRPVFLCNKKEMLLEFEKKVADFIKANELFDSAERVLLAVSGGADSTALLYAMWGLKAKGVFDTELLCAHMNHQLRGNQADLDEDFVIAQAAELKLAIRTKRLDVRGFAGRNKLSIETAARKLRIENLLQIARASDCKMVATAHQKNDNAETVLQRLVRGTGFRGLGGIWPVRAFADDILFVRPLLCVRRDEIIEYLQERNLKWRQDHTNADCTYRRNYIRHRLLPALQQDCTVSVVEQLSKLARSARGFYSLVCSCADKVWPELADCAGEKIRLDSKMFLAQSQPVRVELIRRSLTSIGSGERDLTQHHYEMILQLAEQDVGGRKTELPGGFVVGAEYGKLIFARPQKSENRSQKTEVRNLSSVVLEVPGQTRFGRSLVKAAIFEADEEKFEKFKAKKNNFIERFDFDKIKLPLVVRFREAGDRFIPFGLSAEKKVGKFLTAAQVPQQIRRELLIIADSEKIIWVWPVRLSEQTRITGETRKILQLQITGVPIQAE